jgi:hypothetical protein
MVSIPGSDGAIGELSSLSQPVTGSNPAADFILALFPRGIACYRSTRSLWRTMCLYGAYINIEQLHTKNVFADVGPKQVVPFPMDQEQTRRASFPSYSSLPRDLTVLEV